MHGTTMKTCILFYFNQQCTIYIYSAFVGEKNFEIIYKIHDTYIKNVTVVFKMGMMMMMMMMMIIIIINY
jgi:hypothetical protein